MWELEFLAWFLEIRWTPFPSAMVRQDQPICWGILTHRGPHSALENLGGGNGHVWRLRWTTMVAAPTSKNAFLALQGLPVTHWRGIIVSSQLI